MPADLSEKTPEIVLTPHGALRFGPSSAFWEERLFLLAEERSRQSFWQRIAALCAGALCHATAASDIDGVENMACPTDFAELCAGAPPMPGGEYLVPENLEALWRNLLAWCAAAMRELGGVGPFFELFAPRWARVGTVYFHLGENRLDAGRPFAFMATYVTGISEKGRLRHRPLAAALKDGAREDLLRILAPIQRAAESIPWIEKMCETGQIYRPQAWKPADAYRFLEAGQAMEEAGLGVRLPDWWKRRPRLQVRAKINPAEGSGLGLQALLSFDVRVALGDETLDDAELRHLLGKRGLVLVKNQWVEVDGEKIREALDHWRHVQKRAARGEVNFIEGMRMLAGMDGPDGASFSEDCQAWSRLEAGDAFLQLLDQGRRLPPLAENGIPGLSGTLRPYQLRGVEWMRFLNSLGLGACLADDMGLGKTIQVISLLLLERGQSRMPALLLAPASLMANWRAECARFAPDLRVLVLHPSVCGDMQKAAATLEQYDLVVTSYAMCARLKWLAEREWSRVIADEAQNIKNSHTRQSIAARKLRAPRKIALTGTPIENSAADLWALFDFLNPGLLGSQRQFSLLLRKLQKARNGLAPLRRLAAPYILRRMKADKSIIDSLPDKTEVILPCALVREQAALYQKTVQKMWKMLQDDSGDRNMAILQNLVLLRQICNHPAQAGGGGEYRPERSGKFLQLGEICATIAARQERALIFTQFREIIAPLGEYLRGVFGAPGLALHGQTPVKQRAALVEQFQKEDGPPFFVISLKAGGSGLNLTRASHVIHFDRWWNPAVEDQATDRAYRIGQEKNVLVHKCVTLGTLEEKIDQLIESKRRVAGDVLDGLDGGITAMSNDEILELVRLDAAALLD